MRSFEQKSVGLKTNYSVNIQALVPHKLLSEVIFIHEVNGAEKILTFVHLHLIFGVKMKN